MILRPIFYFEDTKNTGLLIFDSLLFMRATKQVKQSRGQYHTDCTYWYPSVAKKYIACAPKYNVFFFILWPLIARNKLHLF